MRMREESHSFYDIIYYDDKNKSQKVSDVKNEIEIKLNFTFLLSLCVEKPSR